MFRSIHNTLIILRWACHAPVFVWQEPKTVATWSRNYKDVSCTVRCYNHLSNEEREGEPMSRQERGFPDKLTATLGTWGHPVMGMIFTKAALVHAWEKQNTIHIEGRAYRVVSLSFVDTSPDGSTGHVRGELEREGK